MAKHMFRTVGFLSILALAAVASAPGCTVDVEEPTPGGEQRADEGLLDEQPSLEPQCTVVAGKCCYAECWGGDPYYYVGQLCWGQCNPIAKDVCHSLGYEFKAGHWLPC